MAFPILPILDVAGRVLDRVLPDTAAAEKAKAELALELQKQDTQLALGQMEINKVEAASADKFTSRARPAFMWVCTFGFAYHYVLQPFMAFVIVNAGYQLTLPSFDIDALEMGLYGVLGLGGYRTVERVTGKVK